MAALFLLIPEHLFNDYHARRFQRALRVCVALLMLGCAQGSARADVPKPTLVSETATIRAIALEPTELRTQPFAPTTPSYFYGTDSRTRIMLFVQNLSLQPGDNLSALRVEAEDGAHRLYELKVEALSSVPGQDWISQLTLRLNDNMGDVGDVLVGLVYRGVASNRVRVAIGHFGDGLPDDVGSIPTPALTHWNITGQVVENENGMPNVLVTASGDASTTTATTNESGRYTIALKPYIKYTLTASARFFNINPQKLIFNFLSANQSAADFIATRRLHNIGGQVRDDLGRAVSDLPVMLQSSAPGSSSKLINTAHDGSFSFTEVPAGFSYTVTPAGTSVFAFTGQNTSLLDENLSLIFNATRRKYTVSGFVKDQQEVVIGGVTLELKRGNNPDVRTIITDSSGQFSFTDVPAGYNYTLTASSTPYYNFHQQSVQHLQNLSDHQSVTITGKMRSFAVRGLVTDEGNNPLSGSAVLLYTANLTIAKSALTDSAGYYEFLDVPAAYSYTVGPPGIATHSFTTQSLSGLTADLTLDFKGVRRTYTIGGVISDPSNQAIGGVSVTLSGAANNSTVTDASGKYSFSNLPAGFAYNLIVSKTDYIFEPPTRSYYLVKDEKADFTAIRTYKIGGRVTDLEGRGIAGTTITLGGAETGKTLTVSDGSYLFTVRTAGDYHLTPAKEQDFYTFAPASQSLTNLDAHRTANFTADFSLGTNPGYVLEFSGSPGTVDYGLFWPEGDSLGHFFWEFWAMPSEDSHTRYLVSDGYGGAHALLFGFNYGTGDRYNLFGNIWDGSKANFFKSDEGPSPGEWGHFAVGWDGKHLITYYNGVPVGKQPFKGPRISPGRSWGASLLLIGGSDHQNLRGRIAQVRGYEDNNPRAISPESSFAPQTLFSKEGQFLSYYFRPAQIIADLSEGYNAGTHSGKLRGIDYGYTIECPICPKPKFVIDPTAPNFSNPGHPGQINAPTDTPAPMPNGARVFDSFSRNNSTFILGGAGGLSETEGGSAGVQAWWTNIDAGQSQPFGILSGHAVLLRNETAIAWVSTGASTGSLDVRVDRTAGEWGSGGNTGLSFRVTNKDNYFFAYTSDDDDGDPAKPKKLSLGYYRAGIRTVLASGITLPSDNWKTLRVVTTPAGDISVYAGNTHVYSMTSTVFASATGAGLFNSGAGLGLTNRWDNFTVFSEP